MFRYVKGMHRSSSNLVMVHWYLTELLLLEKNKSFQFLLSNFCLDVRIWLKIACVDMLYEFAGQDQICLWSDDFLTKLSLWTLKKIEIFIFYSLSLQWLHTFHSNLIYRYIIELCRSNSNLVVVWWILF
jgi:hypothetical protein